MEDVLYTRNNEEILLDEQDQTGNELGAFLSNRVRTSMQSALDDSTMAGTTGPIMVPMYVFVMLCLMSQAIQAIVNW